MINKHWKHNFDVLISQPLSYAIGRCLRQVGFVILSSDYIGFDINNPNASGGCQAVILYFEDSCLVIEWASKACFTEGIGGIMFHIIPRLILLNTGAEEKFSGNQRELLGNLEIPWGKYIGHELKQISVLVERESPQAIRFKFLSGDVVLAVGSTYEYPTLHIGDGNEILQLHSNQLPNQWHEVRMTEDRIL